MAKKKYALGIDAGGTFFKYSLVGEDGNLLEGSQGKVRVDTEGDRDSVLEGYAAIIRASQKLAGEIGVLLAGVGVSTPGPFDYARHTSLMTHKLKSIYGVDLLEAMRIRCPGTELPMLFLHDSHAFLLGEHFAGAAKGARNAAGVTLGTGTGFALIRDGHLQTNEAKGPYISIFRRPLRGATVEDFLSRRGIIRMYAALSGRDEGEGFDVYDIERFAIDKGDKAAYETFAQTGELLAEALRDILREQEAECLILGGQIAKGFPLMESAIGKGFAGVPCLKKIARAQNIDTAAQIGAAGEVFRMLGAPAEGRKILSI